MAKKGRKIVNGRFYVDKTGSRCRDDVTGRFADCAQCRLCPLPKKRKKR